MTDSLSTTGGIDPELARTMRRLKNVAFFAYLPDEAFNELAEIVTQREFAQDEALLRKDDAVNSMFIIRSGWAKIVTQDVDGSELVISHVGPGQAIGDMSLVDGQPYLVSVIAMTPLKTMVFTRDVFLGWLNRRPLYALEIMHGLADKMRLNTNYVRKAIEWSNKIAQGDYSQPIEQINTEHTTVSTRARPDEAEVAEFLAAFHSMVQGVKTREDTLKQQIQELSIQIDSEKLDQEVDQLTQSNFFKNLKDARERMRRTKDS
jgi:CRP-like cAMP-binding protein